MGDEADDGTKDAGLRLLEIVGDDVELIGWVLGEGPPERDRGVQCRLARFLRAGIEQVVLGEPALDIEAELLAQDLPLMRKQREGLAEFINGLADQGPPGIGQNGPIRGGVDPSGQCGDRVWGAWVARRSRSRATERSAVRRCASAVVVMVVLQTNQAADGLGRPRQVLQFVKQAFDVRRGG